MAFKNLESRFNEKVNQLYTGAKYKFDNGKASNGANDDPIIVRKPGDGYFGGASRALGRALPVSSAVQDVKRITLFTLSIRGVAFLAKQQLLQTGNTFEQTRLINPVFAIGNSVPFLHLRRHLRPVTGGPGGSLLGKTDKSYANVRKLGQLQKSTYESFTKNAGGGVGGFLKKIAGPITSTISAVTAKKNVGEEFGYDQTGWVKSRPELGEADKDYVVGKFNGTTLFSLFGTTIVIPTKTFLFGGFPYRNKFGATPKTGAAWDGNYITYYKITDSKKTTFTLAIAREQSDYAGNATSVAGPDSNLPKNATAQTNKLSPTSQDSLLKNRNSSVMTAVEGQITKYVDKLPTEKDVYGEGGKTTKVPYLKYFVPNKDSGVKDDDVRGVIKGIPNPEVIEQNAKTQTGTNKTIRYVRDKLNKPASGEKVLPAYKNLLTLEPNPSGEIDVSKAVEDPIVVSFAMGNKNHVQFRAFIKDLQQVASPQYKDYQYIGRIEKFISYISVQREVSFKLGIIAFSQEELDIVWKRINYLTGMVFPYGINRGILQPNIIRMNIGRVYVDQPAYVTGLSTNFNELTESWDIAYKKQVPIGATMDMRFNLIEKRTALAGTPLYGITEGIGGFSTSLDAPNPNASTT